jgi:hypothetical protein
MIGDIIRHYNELLDDNSAAENWGIMTNLMQTRRLAFGGRMLCTVLRPHLLTEAEYALIERECATLLGAFSAAYQALMRDDTLRAELDLTELEEQALQIQPGFATPTPCSRLDSFLAHGAGAQGDPVLSFVEYNAETPAGAGYEDILAGAFLELPIMARFQEDYNLRMIPAREPTMNSLLSVYREAGGRETPTIGIIDWDDVPTRNEHYIFQDYFIEHGYPSIVADPRTLEYDGNYLTFEGKPIHIIYKRVLASELLRECGMQHPIVRALRDGKVVMSNPFNCKLLHKKMIFAILSDEANAHLYTPAQQQAIAAHIPWTRKLRERKTILDGQEIDLIPYALDHRHDLVLKPNDEYGGEGVTLGWDTTQEVWERALQKGLGESTIIQRKVLIAEEPFPALVENRLNIAPRLVDLDPYLFMGERAQGCLTRLSGGGLLNVTAGGGSVVPTFVVSPKT